MFAVMAVFGAALLLRGGNETIRANRGEGRDERWAMIDLRATAFAGLVVITAVIVGFMVEIANGRDGSPYGLLGAIAGIAYVVAFLVGALAILSFSGRRMRISTSLAARVRFRRRQLGDATEHEYRKRNDTSPDHA